MDHPKLLRSEARGMKLDSAQAKAAATVVLGLSALLYLANGVNSYLYTRAEGSQVEKRQDRLEAQIDKRLESIEKDIKKLLEQRRR
jgi:predicted DNA-binding transcriptional regulator